MRHIDSGSLGSAPYLCGRRGHESTRGFPPLERESAVSLLGGYRVLFGDEGSLLGASAALIVDIIGPEARDASTLYSLLNAAVTIPFLYMISLDGAGFHHFGTHGLLGTDAALNLLVFAIVAAVFITHGMGLRSETFRR